MTWKEIPSHELMSKLLQRKGITNSPMNPSGLSNNNDNGEGISLDKIQELMGVKPGSKPQEFDFSNAHKQKPQKTVKLREGIKEFYLAVPYPADLPPPPHPIVRLAQPNTINLKAISELSLGKEKHQCIVINGYEPIDLGKSKQMEEKTKNFVCVTIPNSVIRYGNFTSFYVLSEDVVEITETISNSSEDDIEQKNIHTSKQLKVKDFIKSIMIKSLGQ